MSLPYYLIRTAHVNKNTLHLTTLFNQLNQQQAENIKPTSRKPKIIGDFSQSDIFVYDRGHFYSQKSKFQVQKYSKEPDPSLKCWIIFDHLNNTIKDLSLFGNHAIYEIGYPCQVIGENNGLYARNLATLFNRNMDVTEYYRIPHNDSIDYAHADYSGGFTIMIIFKPYFSIVQYEINTEDQVVYQKINDSSVTGGISIRYTVQGKLKTFVRDSSTDYNHITKNGELRNRAFNMVVIRYDPLASPRIEVMIESIDKPDDSDEVPEWSDDPANTDAFFAVGNNQNEGKAFTAICEFKQWNIVLTDTEAKNLFKNKLTTENNEYGETAWLGYTRFPDAPTGGVAFDNNTFDSTAFETD